jgi:hypothetical protein
MALGARRLAGKLSKPPQPFVATAKGDNRRTWQLPKAATGCEAAANPTPIICLTHRGI